MKEARLSADLPERFALLYDHQTEKFDTPLDSRGIADIDAIFELAIRTYPDELPSFNGAERNRHHVYWTEAWWRDFANQHGNTDRNTIWSFRNAAPQVAYVPKPIHAWIEEVMTPPPAPELDVMRARNTAWSAAVVLLRSAHLLDKARDEYDEKKYKTRRVLGHVAGITPVSQASPEEYIDVLDTEYWLSELNFRLNGWHKITGIQEDLQPEHRFLPQARLSHVRNLSARIRSNAFVPLMPDDLAQAA